MNNHAHILFKEALTKRLVLFAWAKERKKTISGEYAAIADKLIHTLDEFEYIRESQVTIVYLSSEQRKCNQNRIIRGDCNRASKRYDWCCPADFFIVLYEPNIENLDEGQLETLIRHELHHVGIERKEDGTERYYIQGHDLEDFKVIIDECGVDWDVTK